MNKKELEYKRALRDFEYEFIKRAMKMFKNDVRRAALHCGIEEKILYKKCKEFGLL